MKNLSKIFASITILLIIASCTKELQFGTNFEYTVTETLQTPYIKDVFKQSQITLKNTFSKEEQSYQIAIKYTQGTSKIKVGTFELAENEYYPITFIDSKALISIMPLSNDITKITISLRNSANLIKETIVQITASEFNITQTPSVPLPLYYANTQFAQVYNLTETGATPNTYSIKYTSTKTADVKIGNITLTPNTFIPIAIGTINTTYKSALTGDHTITFTVKNGQGIERTTNSTVTLLPNLPVLTFTPNALDVKENISKDFTISISNIISSNTYQLKLTSDKTCQFYDANNNIVPSNTYISIPTSTAPLTFKYLALNPANAIITATITNQINETNTAILPITVNKAPKIITVSASKFLISSINEYRYNFIYVQTELGLGETIQAYELTIPFVGILTTNPAGTVSPINTNTYSARIKDSSGRWSLPFTGSFE